MSSLVVVSLYENEKKHKKTPLQTQILCFPILEKNTYNVCRMRTISFDVFDHLTDDGPDHTIDNERVQERIARARLNDDSCSSCNAMRQENKTSSA